MPASGPSIANAAISARRDERHAQGRGPGAPDHPRLPGLLACVLFCQGCAWRCRYCHNPELIAPRGMNPWPRLLDFLRRRQGLLQAVVFSGGEATLQAASATPCARSANWASASACTAPASTPRLRPGAGAERLGGLRRQGAGRDVAAITGVDGSGAANWRSLECLLDSGVAYECRTTVHWRLFDSERLWRLATRLRAMGVERFAVQLARPAASSIRSFSRSPRRRALRSYGENWKSCFRLRTARRLSLRFSGAARPASSLGQGGQSRPGLSFTRLIRSYESTSSILVASNCRGRRRSPPCSRFSDPGPAP